MFCMLLLVYVEAGQPYARCLCAGRCGSFNCASLETVYACDCVKWVLNFWVYATAITIVAGHPHGSALSGVWLREMRLLVTDMNNWINLDSASSEANKWCLWLEFWVPRLRQSYSFHFPGLKPVNVIWLRPQRTLDRAYQDGDFGFNVKFDRLVYCVCSQLSGLNWYE